MSVLIEGTSVVVPSRILDERYPGGERGFLLDAPGLWRHSDGSIACAVFMTPEDVRAMDAHLAGHGITYEAGGKSRDAAVVDMHAGPLRPCSWLDFRYVERDGHRLAAARLRGSQDCDLAVPHGWTWEGSLTAKAGFTRTEDLPREMMFITSDGPDDIYWNVRLGAIVHVPRRT